MTKAAFILWMSLTLCQVTPSRKRPENSSTSGGLAGWTFKVRCQLCRVTRMRSQVNQQKFITTAKCDPLLKTLAFQLVAMALFWLSLPRFSKPHNLGLSFRKVWIFCSGQPLVHFFMGAASSAPCRSLSRLCPNFLYSFSTHFQAFFVGFQDFFFNTDIPCHNSDEEPWYDVPKAFILALLSPVTVGKSSSLFY